MDKSPDEFGSVAEAVRHYQDLCRSLEQQVKEAHDEMDDYTETTKELQQELETELDKVDKSEKGMRLALEAADNDKEEWKAKYTTSLREHTATMTHMQRELESLRASEKAIRNKLRDMEVDNDDLEKSEREKDSSLQDLENRYNKNLERIALLEEELVTKAQLEEEVQRLKDELRDLQEEVAVLKTQSEAAAAAAAVRLEADIVTAASPPSNERPRSASPTSSAGASSFATPRRSGSPASTASSTPPAFGAPKPAFPVARAPSASGSTSGAPSHAAARVRTQSTVRPAASVGGKPRPSSASTPARPSSRASSTVSNLSRSIRGTNLASAVNASGATGMTPKVDREARADARTLSMREATFRMQELTRRLTRTNLSMAARGSGIPRPSMSPAGVQRTATVRRGAGVGGGIGPSRLAFGEGGSVHLRTGSEAESAGGSRPVSRAGLRQSVAGRVSGVPRPMSRQGHNALGASTISSRPMTPSLPSARPSTPSGIRPPVFAAPVNKALASSTRARAGSTVLGASTRGGIAAPTGRAPTANPLGQSVRRPSSRQGTRDGEGEQGRYGVLGGEGRMDPPPMPSPKTQEGAIRRASLASGSRLPARALSAMGRGGRVASGVRRAAEREEF